MQKAVWKSLQTKPSVLLHPMKHSAQVDKAWKSGHPELYHHKHVKKKKPAHPWEPYDKESRKLSPAQQLMEALTRRGHLERSIDETRHALRHAKHTLQSQVKLTHSEQLARMRHLRQHLTLQKARLSTDRNREKREKARIKALKAYLHRSEPKVAAGGAKKPQVPKMIQLQLNTSKQQSNARHHCRQLQAFAKAAMVRLKHAKGLGPLRRVLQRLPNAPDCVHELNQALLKESSAKMQHLDSGMYQEMLLALSEAVTKPTEILIKHHEGQRKTVQFDSKLLQLDKVPWSLHMLRKLHAEWGAFGRSLRSIEMAEASADAGGDTVDEIDEERVAAEVVSELEAIDSD